MSQRELVRIVCASCTGKRPVIARVVDGEDGPRFQSTFTDAVMTATIVEGKGSQGSSLRRRKVSIDVPVEDGEYRCGCPNGHGVVQLERDELLRALAAAEASGRFEIVEVTINAEPTQYRLH